MQNYNPLSFVGLLLAMLTFSSATNATTFPPCEEIVPTGTIENVGTYVTATVGKNFAFKPNQCMYSPNKKYVVWNQGDGAFALYAVDRICMGCALSHIGAGKPSERTWTIFQYDGHLVTYPEKLVREENNSWHGTDSSQTDAWPLPTPHSTIVYDSYFFLIDDDATFSIYRGDSPKTSRGLVVAAKTLTTSKWCVSIRTSNDSPLDSMTIDSPDRVFAFSKGHEFAAQWNNRPAVKDKAERVWVLGWNKSCGK